MRKSLSCHWWQKHHTPKLLRVTQAWCLRAGFSPLDFYPATTLAQTPNEAPAHKDRAAAALAAGAELSLCSCSHRQESLTQPHR